MPHDPEEVIAFVMREHAKQAEEIRRLNRENAQLRALFLELMRVAKEVEENLQNALDKDHK